MFDVELLRMFAVAVILEARTAVLVFASPNFELLMVPLDLGYCPFAVNQGFDFHLVKA
jgi:hypothetical protein